MHTALWVLAAISVLGAGVSLLRPSEESARRAATRPASLDRARRSPRRSRRRRERGRPGRSCGSATSPSWPGRRRGRSATTRRSGCCRPPAGREPGAHRTYAEADVERLTELLRLKDLLGVSLEELKELVEAEGARAALRREWHGGVEDPVRRRQILDESLGHIARQLELVRRRREEIAKLEDELLAQAQAGAGTAARAGPGRSLGSAAAVPAVCSSKCLLSIVTWPW